MIAAMMRFFLTRNANRVQMIIPPVAKPPALEEAEKALHDLLARQTDLGAQTCTWNSRLGSANGNAVEMNRATAELIKIEKNLRQCGQRAIELRTEIQRLWPTYVAEMRSAVAKH